MGFEETGKKYIISLDNPGDNQDKFIKSGARYECLCISLDNSISTLQSNYYINKVCMTYSKLIILNEICFSLLNCVNVSCAIRDYELGCNDYSVLTDSLFDNEKNNILSRWYNLCDYEDVKIFFKLFDSLEMPYIHIMENDIIERTTNGISITVNVSPTIRIAHDYNEDALKVVLVKHFSPPEYLAQGIEDFLKYIITYKREEEIRKINECLKCQEFLYKDVIIVEKIVSISKILSDEEVDGRIKQYVLNSLQVILDEQEKLHQKMGITSTITHVNMLI